MKRYPFWSYLSISAIDAPIISVAWYLYFMQKSDSTTLNLENCFILGFSVWLGYMADRLFDIKSSKEAKFISLRHQFCKQYESILWALWWVILALTLIFSLNTLNSDKIVAGFILLSFVLLYNLLNQYFFPRNFPKELCVATLFAYGTLFLIEGPVNMNYWLNFGLICFLNCLILSHKERKVDQLMDVRSLAHHLNHQSIFILNGLSCIYFFIAFQSMLNPFFVLCIIMITLQKTSQYLDEEHFRVTTESLFVIIPLAALLFY